jgi:YihY family inner membrane protein
VDVAIARPQTPLPIARAAYVARATRRRSPATGRATPPMSLNDALHTFDHRQQHTRGVRFVAAVYKKFTDDQAGQLAALVSYYAFVSIFPLLLVFVTILGFVLQGDPREQQKILDCALGQFPIVSDSLKLHSLKGSAAALLIGVVGALLAGLGIMSAAQNAFNRIWAVPFKSRPNFLFVRLRGLGMVAILGTLTIVSTAAGGFVGASSHGAIAVVAGVVVAFALNVALFMIAFKLLTAIDLDWRVLLPGVVAAAVGWQLLQIIGGYYVEHLLKRTQPLYGYFAVVLGLLAWLYIGAQIVIFAAEVNVVRKRRLWPRSFFSEPLLNADKRAQTSSTEKEERVEQENVEVSFEEPT